ncbi:MAG: hypothetical protein EOP11_11595 [Proteobacteria bacterium]|nr:MAG: hypothetical protein EOP11_11595 [Pseudomonadota bacterium]
MKINLLLLGALLCASGDARIESLLPPTKPLAHFPLFCEECHGEPVPSAACREYCGCTSAFCGSW